jgi:dGTPase
MISVTESSTWKMAVGSAGFRSKKRKTCLRQSLFLESIYRSTLRIAIEYPTNQVEYLRARAINQMIRAVVDVFKDQYEAIMEGRMEDDLMSQCVFAAQAERIKALSLSKIYSDPQVVQVEAAGFEVMSGLLEKFVSPLTKSPGKRTLADRKVLELLPPQFRDRPSPYESLLAATDYVSGMTDSYALTLFRRLRGIELPRG